MWVRLSPSGEGGELGEGGERGDVARSAHPPVPLPAAAGRGGMNSVAENEE
jgi:hypothetical protein